MQKACTALVLDKVGRLLVAGLDGCCYLLNPESLQQEAKLILHPSQTGKRTCCVVHTAVPCVKHGSVLGVYPAQQIMQGHV